MKKISITIFILLVCSLCFQCYYVRQGVALLDIYSSARDIDQLLAREDLAPQERTLLLRVKEIKNFAVADLGLAENGNYTKYIRLSRGYLASVVSACEALSFKQYFWDYPFVGLLPYQGFLNDGEAEEEASALRGRGYDVFVRRVDAFSTLGMLQDPVFSFMGSYPHFALAELILHEQTHATVFLDNQATFNENLASFVGQEGMRLYIHRQGGEDTDEYRTALALEHDRKAYAQAMQELHERLDALYQGAQSADDKGAGKAGIISEWKKESSDTYEQKYLTPYYRKMIDRDINNAVIMTYMNYTEKSKEMEELFALCGRDLPLFIRLARRLSKNEKNPMSALRTLITASSSGS